RFARGGADVQSIALELDLAREATMHAVVFEQMRVGRRWRQIVDRQHLHIIAPALRERAQHVATDPAKTVDGYFCSHDPTSPAAITILEVTRRSATFVSRP